MTSASVTCWDYLPDTPASKGVDIVAPINIKSSINYCAKSFRSSGSDDQNIKTDGDLQDLSSICPLGFTKNDESIPVVLNISVPTHTSFNLPRCLSFQDDASERNVCAGSLPTQGKTMTTEDLLDLDDQQLKGLGDICNLPSASCSISMGQNLNESSYTSWKQGEIKHQTDSFARSRILPWHDKVSNPLTPANLVSSYGFHNNIDGSVADLDRSFDSSNMSGSGKGKFSNNLANVENHTTPGVEEDSIISKILSMELGPEEDSLASPDSLAKSLRQTKENSASINPPSLRKITDNNQSRISFARQENFSNQAYLLDASLGSIMDLNKCSSS